MARNIVLEKYYVLQDFLIKIMIPFKKGKKPDQNSIPRNPLHHYSGTVQDQASPKVKSNTTPNEISNDNIEVCNGTEENAIKSMYGTCILVRSCFFLVGVKNHIKSGQFYIIELVFLSMLWSEGISGFFILPEVLSCLLWF